jgi:PTS system ascorbate-specific IIA component
MSTGLLLITHSSIGDALLETAGKMFEGALLPVKSLSVSTDCNPDHVKQDARLAVQSLDRGEGVLVLTDMFGSTPSNIAYALAENGRVNVISGVNLPMLVRALNYQGLGLAALTQKALNGGKEGIHCCDKNRLGAK